MDFRQSFQGPNNKSTETQESAPAPARSKATAKKLSFNAQSIFSSLLVFGVAVLLVLLTVAMLTRGSSVRTEGQLVKTDKYQAVFLNNGQVYFGKVNNLNGQYVDLRDVYYLTQNTAAGANGTTSATGDYTLVKLGCQQIHNPLDQMVIAREQVAFWENLNGDGKVVKSIQEFKKQNPNGPDCSKVTNQTQSTTQSPTTQSTTNPTGTQATPQATTPTSTR
ncbi:hypothetical protein KBC77_04055 [Candidatus Saccharibacteria bacterium]|nr:hypothetical protein [Candidatus Saccharibacteria bacterium]